MELVVVFALLLALALLAPRFGVDSRGGPDWSLGNVIRSGPGHKPPSNGR